MILLGWVHSVDGAWTKKIFVYFVYCYLIFEVNLILFHNPTNLFFYFYFLQSNKCPMGKLCCCQALYNMKKMCQLGVELWAIYECILVVFFLFDMNLRNWKCIRPANSFFWMRCHILSQNINISIVLYHIVTIFQCIKLVRGYENVIKKTCRKDSPSYLYMTAQEYINLMVYVSGLSSISGSA